VNTTIYSSYSDNYPQGVNFTGPGIDQISTNDFAQFGFNTNWNWHPDGLSKFAADTQGYIQVPAAGSFTFILAGAQDSFAFVDGQLAVAHGSDAVAQNQNTISLSPGIHSVEIQYDIVKPADQFPADIYSGWELTISPPNGFSIVSVPEPVSLSGIGALVLLCLRRRKRSRSSV
jgi:hypothetical protein